MAKTAKAKTKTKSKAKKKTKAKSRTSKKKLLLPMVPVADLLAFPSVMMSLHLARDITRLAVDQAMDNDHKIFILGQREPIVELPGASDLYTFGTIAKIIKQLKLPDGSYKLLIQGETRAKLDKLIDKKEWFQASVEEFKEPSSIKMSAEDELIINRIRENIQVMVQNEHLPDEMMLVTEEIESPGSFADIVVAHYRLEVSIAQQALEETNPSKRLKLADSIVTDDLNQFLVSERIHNQTRQELSKGQQEYYLREQLKQIQKELGKGDEPLDELSELKETLAKAKLPAHAEKEVKRQLRRLERMHVESSEYSLLRTYIECIADLPWTKTTRDKLDLKLAKKILDEDHHGLEKVKDRILEYLSVKKLNKSSNSPILCFVGPPGVGKTSLGKSIASALNRKFFRMSLGGVRDEAEIRGHRRTYVGALPGRIIQGLRQVGSKNPVFVLDELDKVGADFRGDPASALLEVLDPEQNKEFYDHYLNLHFDLSNVMFIATANTVDTIPSALLDRLEVIHISGYTTIEKLSICERYLVPRQLEAKGLNDLGVTFQKSALLLIIERYTQEAGVRNLEREIGSVCRKIAREFAEKGKTSKRVTENTIKEALGPTRFDPETNELGDTVGLVQGLAWTTHGGEVLFVEASTAPGTGQLSLTGQLGSVMQESAQAALFYARSNADLLGLNHNFHKSVDIHIHVPSGATPKDGPSAGVTIVTALVSALSERKVSKDIAMTGEITLRGKVLAVGGLKEKALAALRRGVKKVIIPYENMKDLEEIPKEQRKKITFIPVKHVNEVLEIALLGNPKKKSRQVKKKTKQKSVNKHV